MHYQMEVVIPESLGTDSKEAAEALVFEAMKPFDEDPSGANTTDADADDYVDTRYAFWDWYVPGGRYSGNHFLSSLDSQKLKEFGIERFRYPLFSAASKP